ncbi:MAG: selenium-dependent xanthine dehydrogenase [Calditrichaeota bacterium]|nr:MAG: selenium-dependent xanthine dehydrogenase [Calditrichota bacterium]
MEVYLQIKICQEEYMKFILNGIEKTYQGDPELPLLTFLREQEGITSPKDGCAPQAACGCCAVELNGRAVLSCVTPMKKVEGGRVTTIEGMPPHQQEVFAKAFLAKGGIQCGFCIPGIVMQAKVLIDHNPSPSREEVQKALTHHLCRCTGYKKIEEAILLAAEALRDEKPVEIGNSSGEIGTPLAKYDCYNAVLGQRPYVDDIKMEGMLYGALKFSDHPRAKVLHIDTSAAEALPGVVRVFTAEDIPGERYTGLIVHDWPLMIAKGEETRYVGDVLAGVVAEKESIARKAVELIKVEYEVLPPLTNPHEALKPDAPSIHPRGNLLSETVIKRGDVEQAIKDATYVTHGVYKTQCVEHGFMEPECCIAYPQGNGIKVLSQGQGVYDDQKSIASILGLSLEDVEVELVQNGGGFGGKEDLSVQGHAALYAFLLRKPVKVRLTRDESIRMHPKRHPLEMDYTVACDADGKLLAVKAHIIGDTGAYASVGMKVLERAAGHATGAYHVPNVDIVSRAVYTNNIPNGAMRGFGVNQVTFAMESCVDELCRQGGFDRWEFRYRNALKEGDMTATGQVLRGGVGVRETLLALKEHFYSAKYAGIACGIKNTGIGNGMPDEGAVKIVVEAPDKVVVHHGWTEMGQGVNTMAVQFLCTETGLSPDIVEVRVQTSANAPAGMTTASRATSIIGNAIIAASKKLRQELEEHSLEELVGKTYEGRWVCDWTTKPGADVAEIITHYSYGYASQLVTLDEDGNIEAIYAAHDAGKVINPILFEGQIEGSLHMGLGYAISEKFEYDNGVPKSTRLRKCGILRAKEMPRLEVIAVEVPDPHGPHGAKGVGEIGLVPTAAAVANALCAYDGERRYELPIKIKKRRLSQGKVETADVTQE